MTNRVRLSSKSLQFAPATARPEERGDRPEGQSPWAESGPLLISAASLRGTTLGASRQGLCPEVIFCVQEDIADQTADEAPTVD
jgi:hypothetical protein